MPEKRKTLPGVLLIILSALGIFISIVVIGFSVVSLLFIPPIDQTGASSNGFIEESIVVLAALIGAINLSTLITAARKLQDKPVRILTPPKKSALILMLGVWLASLAAGYFVSRHQNLHVLLAILTAIAVVIPIWILIHFARTGLPHSTAQRERGVLTIGLIVPPPLIVMAEMVFIVIVVIFIVAALGLQTGIFNQLPSLFNEMSGTGGISELESSLFDLMQEPLVAAGVYITLGIAAPLIEEIFKPMAIWFILNRPLQDHEGYAIGLISGGAFALLESAGMIIQIAPQDWLPAVALRAATSVLHIGLSGLVGYGYAHSWSQNKRWNSLAYVLAAAALHGAWNSIAIYAGFSAMPITGSSSEAALASSIIPFMLMGTIFIGLIAINYFINRSLRKHLFSAVHASPEQNSI